MPKSYPKLYNRTTQDDVMRLSRESVDRMQIAMVDRGLFDRRKVGNQGVHRPGDPSINLCLPILEVGELASRSEA